MMEGILVNEYGEVINSPRTYKSLAKALKTKSAVIIGWTDELGCHYDILFCYTAVRKEGNYLQRGINPSDLFVSIIGKGAFGFKTEHTKESSYIAEKLNLGINETTKRFTDLINGIIAELEV